ncbi:hypothetical protein TIFTF001_033127 [Ficus carica]|uniref:PGG domain-containing protein n=1 Tax=Ficus carica TaxID=3494 RepID=A0AA88DYD4_FICCA|nr:hypothetical protein TIFTF001_033127 [Ficus carica]
MYDLKQVHIQYRKLLDFLCNEITTSDAKQVRLARLSDAILEAVNQGNDEYIISIAKAKPDLLWDKNVNARAFTRAVEHRQAEVFSLIHGLPDKETIASFCYEDRSNMLHRVASVAPSRLLNHVPGPALQMQRGLQWYKEVETIISLLGGVKRNDESLLPSEIFTESHKDLVIAGEKWIKDKLSSCTFVGALIFTMTFAAAFTVPGGNNGETGFPMFAKEKLFKLFILSDAISLFSSTTSVLAFVGILTSRYAEEDFFVSLPRKMIIGLDTLFLSIAIMMVAFCVGLDIMLPGDSGITIPVISLASVPNLHDYVPNVPTYLGILAIMRNPIGTHFGIFG